jgi:hypothetical protein
MRNARMHIDATARKPRTVMTAMAQCGNPEPDESDCTEPELADEEAALELAAADDMDA